MAGVRAPLGALLAGALLIAGAAVPAAKAADGRLRGWVLTRQGPASRPIEGEFWSTPTSEEGHVIVFALTGRGAQRRLDYRITTTMFSTGVDPWAQFRAGDVQSPSCVAACTVPVGDRQRVVVSSQGRALSSTAVYIVAYDNGDPELTVSSPGWTVKTFRPTLRMLGMTAGGQGVTAAHTAIGTYRGGELDGGPAGSLGWASLPCGHRGKGSGTLYGGTYPRSMRCEFSTGALDSAPRRVRWRVEADTVGYGFETTTLVVVDFPPE